MQFSQQLILALNIIASVLFTFQLHGKPKYLVQQYIFFDLVAFDGNFLILCPKRTKIYLVFHNFHEQKSEPFIARATK